MIDETTRRFDVKATSDGFTAKAVVFLSPYIVGLLLYLFISAALIDNLLEEVPVYNMTTNPYCSCSPTQLTFKTLPAFTDDGCQQACMADKTCNHTTLEYLNVTEPVITCRLYPDMCERLVCIDPFTATHDVRQSILFVKKIKTVLLRLL